jgi:RNA polymerase sigma factor (sigma-70 family)
MLGPLMEKVPRRLELARLHSEHGRVLYAIAHRMLLDASEAEDAVQEAFLRACRSPRLLFFSPNFPWLYRITLNVCLEFLRSRRRRPVTSSQLEELASSHRHRTDDVIDARRDLEALCESADGRDLEILVSHFVLGCDQTEIANQLGISRRAVVKRLTKLRGGTALTERTTLNG